MSQRKISLSEEANKFLGTYEVELMRRGYPTHFVEDIAAKIFDVIFVKIPNGRLVNDPKYLGPNRNQKGFSTYTFAEGDISGSYTCSPGFVHFLSMEFNFSYDASSASEWNRIGRRA